MGSDKDGIVLHEYYNGMFPLVLSFFLSFLGILFITHDNVFIGGLLLLSIPLSFALFFEKRVCFYDKDKGVVSEGYVKHKKFHMVKEIKLDMVDAVLLTSQTHRGSTMGNGVRDVNGNVTAYKPKFFTF